MTFGHADVCVQVASLNPLTLVTTTKAKFIWNSELAGFKRNCVQIPEHRCKCITLNWFYEIRLEMKLRVWAYGGGKLNWQIKGGKGKGRKVFSKDWSQLNSRVGFLAPSGRLRKNNDHKLIWLAYGQIEHNVLAAIVTWTKTNTM